MKELLLVNKPKGMSSHDVVAYARRVTGIKKIGHGGTLDPNATGLLILGIGREGTKQLGTISKGLDKTYEAEIVLGFTSTTDDPEGELTHISDERPSITQIELVLGKFTGELTQTPPIYSAIKVDGKKAYNEARKGRSIILPARSVTIHELKLVKYDYPDLNIICKVSSGTYIRALARDIGEALGVGGYLANLRRTRIGDYNLDDAIELAEIEKLWKL